MLPGRLWKISSEVSRDFTVRAKTRSRKVSESGARNKVALARLQTDFGKGYVSFQHCAVGQ